MCECRAAFWVNSSFYTEKLKSGDKWCSLASKLLLPVAGDLAALGLDGLLAVGPGARPLPGAESTVPFVGYTDAPLPLSTV